jgi:hypothetical protein
MCGPPCPPKWRYFPNRFAAHHQIVEIFLVNVHAAQHAETHATRSVGENAVAGLGVPDPTPTATAAGVAG